MLMTAVGSPPTYKPALATLGVIAGEGSTKQLLVTVCFLSNVPFKFGESIGLRSLVFNCWNVMPALVLNLPWASRSG